MNSLRSGTAANLAIAAALFVPCVGRAELAAHYALDEAFDTSGPAAETLGANDGTLINPPDVVRGRPAPHANLGTAYDFGLSGGIDLGTAAAVRPTDRFTMTWWMRPDTLNAFDRLYESLSGTADNGSGIRIDLASSGNQARVLLRDGNGGSNTQLTHSLVLRNDGTWYFFALRYDSGVGNGTAMKLTVLENQAAATDADIAGATQSPGALGTGPINIHNQGAYIATDDPAGASPNDFGGGMDDIAIFTDGDGGGVLTDAQLAQVFNEGAIALADFRPPRSKALPRARQVVKRHRVTLS
ncbi:MAG: LamG-like jellyroll fold domain-containing protein [Verrucomicrobiales bacterium]